MPRVPRRPSDEARRGAYKPPGVDAARSRRRREDRLLALRRRNRDAGLFKRRREEPSLAPAPVAPPSDAAADATAPPPPPGPSSAPSSPPPADALRAAADAELEGLSEMVDKVWSDDTTSQLEATVQFRKLLSDGKNSTMIKIIRADVLPRFAEFLSRQRLPQLQMEAAWVLTNIAASDYTLLVAECGAVPRLVELLDSPNANIRHQALWALGNIAADMPSCREIVLDHGAVTPLLAQFKEDMKVSVLRTATWALSNLCFGKLPAEVQVKPILEIISLLIHSADEKILADACWALYYICDGVEGGIQDALDAGVCPQLVKLLMHASANILLPVITSLARISAGDDTQVQVIIENGILPCLTQLLARNYPKIIKKQTCLIVSNITAGSKDQIQAVIDADVMNHVIVLLKTSETDLKKEAAWAISNAASGGSSDQIQYLVSRGCLEPLCNVLKYQDVDLVYTCLEGLQNILEEGETGRQGNECATNPYAQFILENGGLDNLEDLQDFDNDAVYKLAMKLLERYWDEEVSDEANLTASKDSPAENVEAVPEDAAPPPVAAPSVDGTE
ncbi:importin subunit alpha-1a-like isoform X1 [Hordeum vulgare subsp. vulgare]|uniref:Importin subunit alpha n=2 Tax=Hordeum vulgare subsp. vulgare TaxID=112509 RepID=A0A8I7B4U3_HORVV|nr:importin subunit alpha-1a-like isoform X1 [Hordeum vulgare subsp. vulgare]